MPETTPKIGLCLEEGTPDLKRVSWQGKQERGNREVAESFSLGKVWLKGHLEAWSNISVTLTD